MQVNKIMNGDVGMYFAKKSWEQESPLSNTSIINGTSTIMCN